MNEIMVSVDVASAQLAELVEQIHARGHTVVLTKNGQPLARLVPLPAVRTRDELSAYLGSSGVEPPLPGAVLPPPLPHEAHVPPLVHELHPPPLAHESHLPPVRETHVPPRIPREPHAAPRAHPDGHAAKKNGPPVQLLFSIGLAVLAGVTVILLVTLIVRFAVMPGPTFTHPEKMKSRPAVRDTSSAIARAWNRLPA